MSNLDAVGTASRRLAQAIEALEAVVERRCDGDRDETGLARQVQTFGADRARLAAELDAAAARSRSLETATQAVVRRLDTAMATIRGVLAANGSGATGE